MYIYNIQYIIEYLCGCANDAPEKKQIYQSKHLHHQTGCTLAYKDMGVKLSLEAAAVGTQLDDGWNLYDPGLLAHPHASDKPDQLNETKTQQSKEAMSS